MSDRQHFMAVLGQMLKFPSQWKRSGDYRIKHKPSGIEMWCGRGVPFYKVWSPERLDLKIMEKLRFWRRIVRIKRYCKREVMPESLMRLAHFNHQAPQKLNAQRRAAMQHYSGMLNQAVLGTKK